MLKYKIPQIVTLTPFINMNLSLLSKHEKSDYPN